MRKLGRALGVEAMSLYHWFPDRSAILDGLVEAVYAEMPPPPRFDPATDDWQRYVEDCMGLMLTHLRRHPGALAVLAVRPVRSAPAVLLFERVLEAVLASGAGTLAAVYAVSNLAMYTLGHALAAVGRQPWGVPDPSNGDVDATLDELIGTAGTVDLPVLESRRHDPEIQAFDLDDQFAQGLRAFLTGLSAAPAAAEKPQAGTRDRVEDAPRTR
jgi:TetR/AcrR family tetracycline transcriptional repressor